jgi:chromosome segregation ATPase
MLLSALCWLSMPNGSACFSQTSRTLQAAESDLRQQAKEVQAVQAAELSTLRSNEAELLARIAELGGQASKEAASRQELEQAHHATEAKLREVQDARQRVEEQLAAAQQAYNAARQQLADALQARTVAEEAAEQLRVDHTAATAQVQQQAALLAQVQQQSEQFSRQLAAAEARVCVEEAARKELDDAAREAIADLSAQLDRALGVAAATRSELLAVERERDVATADRNSFQEQVSSAAAAKVGGGRAQSQGASCLLPEHARALL